MPVLMRKRWSRVGKLLPSRASPPLAMVDDFPDIVPPDQVNKPATVKLPTPVNVPPERVNWLLIVEVLSRVKEPPDKTTVLGPVVRLLILSVPEEWVTVMLGISITASSPAMGIRKSQLLRFPQSPVPPTQWTASRSVRFSRPSN